MEFRSLELQKLEDVVEFRGVRLENLDLSGSILASVGISGCTILNCRFDAARCQHLRIWEATIEKTTFIETDLRDSFLGRWRDGREPAYLQVNFSRADFRGASVSAATFIDCDFSNARLVKMDFQSSSFIRCRFAGELREVLFYDRGFQTGKPDPNRMEDVDFSKAKLRWVAFRGLNLDRLKLPQDEEHLILRHYRCVLQRAIRELGGDERVMARGLRALLADALKWIGPRQEVGIFNRHDLGEYGKDEAEFAVTLLRRLDTECAAEGRTRS